MTVDVSQKIQAGHLKRNAYLYVRQSTLRQVLENKESTFRQYDLKQRAVALGWPRDHIIVIDADQAHSAKSAADRDGFQKLVTEVSMGRAGLVMGLEVSRLARNNADWHRLLEICALTDTLLLDEDGLYNPSYFNDRLVLGLKGTMSEAELHMLRARLLGGVLNKARRGALQCRLPIGFVYDPAGHTVLDPDLQVQQSVRLFFETFRRTGSATATVKSFCEERLQFPHRAARSPYAGEVIWGELEHSRALWILHNPRYAGAFFFGPTRQRKSSGSGCCSKKLPRDEWTAFIPNAHPGYISWEEFEQNQRRLHDNAAAHGSDRPSGPPREGPALLQGVAVCGICGQRMTVRYHRIGRQLQPEYVCQREGIRRGERICQSLRGASIDRAIGELRIESVNPMALEVTLAVQQEMQTRLQEADVLRKQRVTRSEYEVELARRRFMRVDPDHRLVASSLEAEWNEKLRALEEAQREYDEQRNKDRTILDEETRSRILALASDFPRLWQDPNTSDRDRKRMLRLLVEDVTLVKGNEITASVRFRGGATKVLTLLLPLPAWKLRETSPQVLSEINRLLDDYTDSQIAAVLTERGYRSGEKKPINAGMVWRLRRKHGLKTRYQRLQEKGMLTLEEIAAKLGIASATAKVWHRAGYLHGYRYDDRGQCLFESPGPNSPRRYKRKAGLYPFRAERSAAARSTGAV
jgi:DNA invertase Pin-like site-specific DNA recombinase